LQQYDENHCVYLARIRTSQRKSRRKRDHTCTAENCLDLHNLLANCSTVSPAYYLLLLMVECAVVGLCKNAAVLPWVPRESVCAVWGDSVYCIQEDLCRQAHELTGPETQAHPVRIATVKNYFVSGMKCVQNCSLLLLFVSVWTQNCWWEVDACVSVVECWVNKVQKRSNIRVSSPVWVRGVCVVYQNRPTPFPGRMS